MRIPGGQGTRFDRDAQVNRDEIRSLRARLQQIERDNPRLLGRLIENVALVTGPNEIEHGLFVKGVRVPLRGWEVVSDDARPVRVQAYRSAAWTVNPGAVANALTTIVFDTVSLDFASDYSSGTGIITVPYTGWYTFHAGAGYTATVGDISYVALRINAAVTYYGNRHAVGGSINSWFRCHTKFVATAGQQVDFQIALSTAAARVGLTGFATTHLQVESDETLTGDQANSSDPTRLLAPLLSTHTYGNSSGMVIV